MTSAVVDAKATLVVFSPVLGKFLIKNPQSDKAILDARAIIGDTEWKKGYTPEKSKQLGEILAKAGVHPIVVTGNLKRVYPDQTRDIQGNTYDKVRIILQDPMETIMMSLEATHELTAIALQQLYNTEPMDFLTFTAFQEPRTSGDRIFYNHRVKLTRSDGSSVAPLAGAWKCAQDKANAATEPFRAQNNPAFKKIINELANTAKTAYHLDLLRNDIAPRFK